MPSIKQFSAISWIKVKRRVFSNCKCIAHSYNICRVTGYPIYKLAQKAKYLKWIDVTCTKVGFPSIVSNRRHIQLYLIPNQHKNTHNYFIFSLTLDWKLRARDTERRRNILFKVLKHYYQNFPVIVKSTNMWVMQCYKIQVSAISGPRAKSSPPLVFNPSCFQKKFFRF